MNPYDNPIITYVKAASEYSSDCELESKNLFNLSHEEESALLVYLLNRGNPTISKKLEKMGFLSIEEIKENKGLVYTNKDKFYFPAPYLMEEVSQNEKIPIHKLDKLDKIENAGCFIRVKTPKFIQDQIDAHKNQKTQKKKLTEEQKLARKLKKAEKLLKEAGKL